MTQADWIVILPVLVTVVWALALLLVDLWIPKQRKGWTALLAAVGLGVSLAMAILQLGKNVVGFGGMVTLDGFAVFLNVLFLVTGLTAIALSYDYLKRMGIERGEYYVLMMLSLSGMQLMAYATDLIVVFLSLELLSIPLYVLAGFARPRLESEESALKYFLLGAFASGFVLYGVAMLFGATTHTDLAGILASVKTGTANPSLLLVGAGLLLVGFGFKVAAVPFHMWTPDVYQGAPSSVTSFMAVGAKAAGFAALLRIFISAFPTIAATLSPILWVLAALTMITGNVLAVSQTNIKRMLAYSSIAHAGYILMAFVPFGVASVVSNSVASALFYLMAYAFTSFGAWAVVIAVEKADGKGLELNDYAGLGRKYPLLAIPMVVFMLSFAGVPLTLGFWGKFYLFRTAVEGGYLWLALIGLLTSLVSAYYYLRVVVMMYMREGDVEASRNLWVTLTAVVAAVAVVGLSFIPASIFEWAVRAVLTLIS